jgi:hypothetical protein
MDQIGKIIKKKEKKTWISIIGLSRSPSVQDALLLLFYFLFPQFYNVAIGQSDNP